MISSGRGPFGRPRFIESAKLVLSEPAKKQAQTRLKHVENYWKTKTIYHKQHISRLMSQNLIKGKSHQPFTQL